MASSFSPTVPRYSPQTSEGLSRDFCAPRLCAQTPFILAIISFKCHGRAAGMMGELSLIKPVGSFQAKACHLFSEIKCWHPRYFSSPKDFSPKKLAARANDPSFKGQSLKQDGGYSASLTIPHDTWEGRLSCFSVSLPVTYTKSMPVTLVLFADRKTSRGCGTRQVEEAFGFCRQQLTVCPCWEGSVMCVAWRHPGECATWVSGFESEFFWF